MRHEPHPDDPRRCYRAEVTKDCPLDKTAGHIWVGGRPGEGRAFLPNYHRLSWAAYGAEGARAARAVYTQEGAR